MLVLATGPIAEALVRVGQAMDMQVDVVDQAAAQTRLDSAAAVLVASHGADEPPVLTAALRAGVPYVGLVASRKRGHGVLAGLQVSDEQLARVHTPAGLDIGARTPSEIAVAILAEIVSLRSRDTTPVECVVPGVVSGAAQQTSDGVSPIPAD
jgi:xanthine dehydrogenase accessory factor